MRRLLLACLVIALLGGAGWWGFGRLMAPVVPTFASDEEHFKYGSIGNDGATGVPFAIWAVLPDVFPDLLPGPGGYRSLGFVYDPAGSSDVPIGFSRARVGVDRMAINCAFCHTTQLRETTDAELRIIPTAPSNTVDVLGYQRFLAAAASDPRFSAEHLLPAMAARGDVPWLERQMHRLLLIGLTRSEIQAQRDAFAWTETRPEWGPGRIDPFNPVKFGMLGLADDGTVGNSVNQPVWNLDAREALRPNGPLHWDGLNTSIREVVISSALGDGAVAEEFDFAAMDRIEGYLRRTAPPPSPHRPDPDAVVRGADLFAANCALCHGADGERVLTVIPIDEVGTDAERVAMWTDEARDGYNDYRVGYDWGFRNFQNVEGYVALPHWGLWLTGPYLHNGSVPTLADLLERPEDRPTAFLRGSIVLDGERGGFVSPPCDPANPPPRAEGFCLDTAERGNGNGGHLWGTELDDAEKADLLAYLLTL